MDSQSPAPGEQISCVSLGMLILDEIHTPNAPPLHNIIGGSSTFVTLGARLFATPSLHPGCLVISGSDFPPEIKAEIATWETHLVVRERNAPSSRGRLTYTDSTFSAKDFTYTTPPLRPTPRDLLNTPLLRARGFHFFGAPDEILTQVGQLLGLRADHAPDLPLPLVVWEPLPSSCVPGNLAAFQAACGVVDVFSPNHIEFGALMGMHVADSTDTSEGLLSVLEDGGRRFLAPLTSSQSLTLLLRAGADGALALQHSQPVLHVPAFHVDSTKVVDATGAGNAFLGGYAAGIVRGEGVRGAMQCGAVAASYAVEQVGLPLGVEEGGGEGRLKEFRARLNGME